MWRQSDGHATTYNLYLDSSSFFTPRTLDLDMGYEARGGMEFQLLYVMAAQWDQWLGSYHSSTLNWIHFLFILTAFLLFAYTIFRTQGSTNFFYYFISLLLLLGVWSSGLFQYYSLNNFPDIAAFAATLIAFSIFYHPNTTFSKHKLWSSGIFFALAGLFKISFLIFPIAILSSYSIFPQKNKSRWTYLLTLGLIIGVVIAWISYMRYYNNYWQSTGFLSSTVPIWELSNERKELIWLRFKNEYLTRLLSTGWIYVYTIVFILNFMYIQRREQLVQLSALAGTAIYILLFYAQFYDHSYYLILLYPLLCLTITYFIKYTMIHWPKEKTTKFITSALLLLFLYQQSKQTSNYLENNYDENNAHHTYAGIPDEYLDEEEVDGFLEKHGIQKNVKFISYPDGSTNVSLHTLKRYGWSVPKDQLSGEKITDLERKGADYLIHWATGTTLPKTNKLEYIDSLAGGSRLYKLQH